MEGLAFGIGKEFAGTAKEEESGTVTQRSQRKEHRVHRGRNKKITP